MESSAKKMVLSVGGYVGAYLLAWWSNAPAFTSISRATVWGLLASALFCLVWSALAVYHSKHKWVLWLSFFALACPLFVIALSAVGLQRYLDLFGLAYFSALYAVMPYLGFALLGEICLVLVLAVQCVFFFALLVWRCKRALLVPVVVIAVWSGITWRIPLDMLAPPTNHINAMSVALDDISTQDWTTVEITDRAQGEAIYHALEETTVRYLRPCEFTPYGDDDCILTLTLGGNRLDFNNKGDVIIDGQRFLCTNGTELYELLLETAQ